MLVALPAGPVDALRLRLVDELTPLVAGYEQLPGGRKREQLGRVEQIAERGQSVGAVRYFNRRAATPRTVSSP